MAHLEASDDRLPVPAPLAARMRRLPFRSKCEPRCGRISAGHEVVVLSRTPGSTGTRSRVVAWNAETIGPWAGEIDGTDIVVHLAGRSVDRRYTATNRRLIRESRVKSTTAVG